MEWYDANGVVSSSRDPRPQRKSYSSWREERNDVIAKTDAMLQIPHLTRENQDKEFTCIANNSHLTAMKNVTIKINMFCKYLFNQAKLIN